MSETDTQQKSNQNLGVSVAIFAAQVGCLTVLITGVAIVVGLWIDRLLNTAPWMTLVLIIISVPVTMVFLVRVAKKAGSRLDNSQQNSEVISQEDADIGNNS